MCEGFSHCTVSREYPIEHQSMEGVMAGGNMRPHILVSIVCSRLYDERVRGAEEGKSPN